MISTVLYIDMSMISVPVLVDEISWMKTKAQFLVVLQTMYWILPTVKYSGQACWSYKQLVIWVLLYIPIISTFITQPGLYPVYHTTKCLCSCSCILDGPPRLGAINHRNYSFPIFENILLESGHSWIYSCSILFRNKANHQHSVCKWLVWDWLPNGPSPQIPQIGLIWC